MQYALLIYSARARAEDLSARGDRTPDGRVRRLHRAHPRARAPCKAGEALHPIATATTVRVRDGRTVTTDGPFAETKEVLGGFYIVDAADLDEAIALRRDDPRREERLASRCGPIWTTRCGGSRHAAAGSTRN